MANKKANFHREMVLLNATTEFQFYGDIIIQPRDDAILTATKSTKSDLKDQHRVFFVDGTSFTRVKGRQYVPGVGKTASGAAVVYMSPGVAQVWEERLFALPKGGNYLKAELAAIAEGLAVAVPEVIRAKDQNILAGPEGTLTKPKVTIFTDCQYALQRINKLSKVIFTKQRLCGDPIIRKLITRSQYLHDLGVDVELRWVPGHSHVEGNVRADAAARQAATSGNLGVSLDEGLRLMESAVVTG